MMTKKTPVIMKHPKLYTKNEKGKNEGHQGDIACRVDTTVQRRNSTMPCTK